MNVGCHAITAKGKKCGKPVTYMVFVKGMAGASPVCSYHAKLAPKWHGYQGKRKIKK